MDQVNQSKLRIGNFTSSEIVALTKDTKAKQTYIDECNYERKLGRSIENESNAKPLTWGKLVEGRVFDLLGIEYQLVSQETILHPDISYWSGSPDANKFDEGKTVGDIKAPITLKSFCTLVEPLYKGLNGMDAMNWVRKNHKDGEKFFFQLVSNSILTKSKFAELIVYCPFKSELDAIREIVQCGDGEMQGKYGWINWATDDELPWLPDDGYYKNLNVIRFEVPTDEKIKLHQSVIECGKQLISTEQLIIWQKTNQLIEA